jgi:opacity protein-like surface antigen
MKMKLSTLCLALVPCLAASAQDADHIVLSAGLMFAQGNALDLTAKTSGGYGAEVGYQFSPKDYGVDFLVYGGWKKLPAAKATADRATYALMGPHFGVDLVYRPWDTLPLTLSTGPSAHVWQVEQQAVANGNMGDQGLKLGWRVGVAYDVTKAWSIGLKYTLTEWRSNPDSGIPPTRPAFVSFVAGYRF